MYFQSNPQTSLNVNCEHHLQSLGVNSSSSQNPSVIKLLKEVCPLSKNEGSAGCLSRLIKPDTPVVGYHVQESGILTRKAEAFPGWQLTSTLD